MLLKDPRWLTRLGSCSPDWNPGYTLSYTIWSEICLTENCCRSHSKSCTNLGFLKNIPVSTYGICSCFYTVESYIYHITWCILDVVHEYKQKRLWTCKIWINLNAFCSIWCHPKTRTRRIGWDVWMLIVAILCRACIFLQVYMKHGWF